MSTSYENHRDKVESARRDNGEFGTYAAGESGATLLTSQDVGEQAYDSLTTDEQEAWQAWREMTGKSEETVVGQSKADDIAAFKKHHLSSGPDDGLPDMATAGRLGLSSNEQDALAQWDEMVSAGTIEQWQDEDGEFHSFAHPHLARTIATESAPERATPRELPEAHPVILESVEEELMSEYKVTDDEHDEAMAESERLIREGDGDDADFMEVTEEALKNTRGYAHESELDEFEPDFDDYTVRSQDGVMQAGLSNLQYGDIYWDHEQAYSSASEEGRSGALGFDARGSFSDVEAEHLPEDLVEQVQRSGDRNLSIASYSPSYSRTQCGESNQFVSVELNEAERNAVVDHLDGENPDEFNEDLVHFWSAGDPAQMDGTFGLNNPKKAWDSVSDAVRERAPQAAYALETAEDLRRQANKSFEAEVDYVNSDDFKKEGARQQAELA